MALVAVTRLRNKQHQLDLLWLGRGESQWKRAAPPAPMHPPSPQSMSDTFTLHPQLAHDCALVGRFPLCLLLLMRDANYPWFILVPQRDGVGEIYELTDADQHQLLHESMVLSPAIMTAFDGDKLNVAALGNVVPQLHIHHVVRRHGDPAWPAPVWGAVPSKAYGEDALQERINTVRRILPAPFDGAH